MQFTDKLSKGAFPHGGSAPAPDIANQMRAQREYYKRIQFRRFVDFWWYRILLIILAVVLAQILGWVVATYPTSIKFVIVGAIALPAIVLLIKRLNVGLFVLAVVATPFLPQAFPIKSLSVYPCIPVVILLFCTLLVQVAFRVRKTFLPSFWVLWPYMAMILMAIISVILVQFTWTHGVPKKINSNPIYYDEILGVGTYFFPLITYMVVTTIVSKWEKLIQYILNIFLAASCIGAVIVFFEFRRTGGNVNTFRFADPHIFWMSLRALAQLMCLGSFIAYVRFLYPAPVRVQIENMRVPFLRKLSSLLRLIGGTRELFPSREITLKPGQMRLIYGFLTVFFTGAILVTLQNSWWIELGVGLVVITVVASFRLLMFYGLLALPFIPLVKAEFDKLQSVKADDFLRFIIWQDSLRVWTKQPILGVGPGDFWAYDQVFTLLPRIYRNCNATGLCVAHNGYLQSLGELGPLGLFFYISASVVVIVAAVRLYRRSRMPIVRKDNVLNSFLQALGVYEYSDLTGRNDRLLALTGLGLVCGSMAADFFIGEFMLPPRQVSVFNVIPQVMVSWIVYGLVMYKDQLWRKARKQLRLMAKRRKLLHSMFQFQPFDRLGETNA